MQPGNIGTVGTIVVTIAVVPSGTLSQPLFSSLWERHHRGAAIDKTGARSEHAKGRKPRRINEREAMGQVGLVATKIRTAREPAFLRSWRRRHREAQSGHSQDNPNAVKKSRRSPEPISPSPLESKLHGSSPVTQS